MTSTCAPLRSRRHVSRLFAPTLALTCLFARAPEALAQSGEFSSLAIAVQLFDEAGELTDEGRFAEACPKYEESYKLDPQLGVLLHLADCYEHLGRLATAWATFRSAEDLAGKLEDARVTVARGRAAALEPRLNRLVLRVAEPTPGLEVSRNGQTVGQAQWGVPVVVDVGVQRIEARGPGLVPFSRDLEVTGEGNSFELEIQTERLPAPSPSAARPDSKRSDDSATGNSPFTPVVLAAGGATLLCAVGTVVTSVLYMDKRSDFHELNAGRGPVDEKESLRDEASTLGWISTGFGALTAIGAGVTTYLVTSARSEASPATPAPTHSVRFMPWAGSRSAGILLGGTL